MAKMSRMEREDGLELFDRIWEQCRGHSPDVIAFALISVLATLIGGAAANPEKMAQDLALRLVDPVKRPPEKSELNQPRAMAAARR